MENLELLKIRARYSNNDRQHDRMVEHKLKSFHRALLYSYQAAWIKSDMKEDADWCRALINPDKVKFDYDEKTLSVDKRWGFEPGDTFEWKGTDTHWILLKQEMTELAYWRGNIRRCQLIEVTDPETGENVRVWAAIRGPVETTIVDIQKAGLVADVRNRTLDIYMKLTEQNRRLFARYKRFFFFGEWWEVQSPDQISTPGVLEVIAIETAHCDHEDLLVQPIEEHPEIEEQIKIEGDSFIKPLTTHTYKVNLYNSAISWKVQFVAEKNKDIDDFVQYKTLEDGTLSLKWTSTVTGTFVIIYGQYEKTVVVESLF